MTDEFNGLCGLCGFCVDRRLSERRERQARPADQKCEAAERGDRAEDGHAGEGESIEAAREQDDAGENAQPAVWISQPPRRPMITDTSSRPSAWYM